MLPWAEEHEVEAAIGMVGLSHPLACGMPSKFNHPNPLALAGAISRASLHEPEQHAPPTQ